MKTFKQAFGYQGELSNPDRSTDQGIVSYLVWNLKDSHGARAGQGVYIWKIEFIFPDKATKEIQYVRTGLLRVKP